MKARLNFCCRVDFFFFFWFFFVLLHGCVFWKLIFGWFAFWVNHNLCFETKIISDWCKGVWREVWRGHCCHWQTNRVSDVAVESEKKKKKDDGWHWQVTMCVYVWCREAVAAEMEKHKKGLLAERYHYNSGECSVMHVSRVAWTHLCCSAHDWYGGRQVEVGRRRRAAPRHWGASGCLYVVTLRFPPFSLLSFSSLFPCSIAHTPLLLSIVLGPKTEADLKPKPKVKKSSTHYSLSCYLNIRVFDLIYLFIFFKK